MIDDLLREARCETDDDRERVRRAILQLVVAPIAPDRLARPVDVLIEEIDARLGAQLDAILRHPDLQKLEAAWRALKYLVDQVDLRENVRVEMLNVSKEDLRNDFEAAPGLEASGLYKLVYSSAYGVGGGTPFGLIVGNYDFGPDAEDVAVLRQVAAVAAVAHAPFVAAASPSMFGLDSWADLPGLEDLGGLLGGPAHAHWQAFRERRDACYVALALPRVLLRAPYGARDVGVEAFDFEEDVAGHHARYLWGNAAVALAACVAGSFARYRWCPNIIGWDGGVVEGLPRHRYESAGESHTTLPVECRLTERREHELSEEGFVGLTYDLRGDAPVFFAVSSCRKARYFGPSTDGREAETRERLGGQLPYLLVASRFAHYLKVLARDRIGDWMERRDLEYVLGDWLRGLVADMDAPVPAIRARRPLRGASVMVTDVEGQPCWYRFDLVVRPHFKFMGAHFDLALVGKIDKG